jgi:hypothetical protein
MQKLVVTELRANRLGHGIQVEGGDRGGPLLDGGIYFVEGTCDRSNPWG